MASAFIQGWIVTFWSETYITPELDPVTKKMDPILGKVQKKGPNFKIPGNGSKKQMNCSMVYPSLSS